MTLPNEHHPRSVTDPFCAQGHVVLETPDRRWLWHVLDGLPRGHVDARALRRYLADTCTHHWHDVTTGEPETRWQCIWCCHIEDGRYPFPYPTVTAPGEMPA